MIMIILRMKIIHQKVQRIQNKNKADNTEKVGSRGGVLCACTHALP